MATRAWRKVALLAVVAAVVGAAGTTGFTESAAPGLQPATRVTPPPRRASFAFTGDILTHRPVNYSALQSDGTFDYSSMFARVAPLLSYVDVPICHLEQPVAPPGTAVIVGPAIHSVAPSIGTALAGAGYRRCSTASNHNLDRGIAGIDATVAALTSAGVGQSGLARTPAESVVELFDVNGITVAHLSYTYSTGGSLPYAERWRVKVIDSGAIVAAARDARARGADVVIASLHWGDSGRVAPSTYQRQVAWAITAAGDIDLVVGHHAHVLQPIEQVNGTWVVWGLGNFLSDMPSAPFWPASTQDGAIVTVALTQDAAGSVSVERPVVYPTWVDRARGHVVRLTSEASDPTLPLSVRNELAISEARTRSVLGAFFAPA